MRIFSKRRIWVVLLLICAAAGVWIVANDQSAARHVEWLSSRPVMRARLGFLGQWSGPVKRQLLRLKQSFLGPTKMVTVTGTILEFDSPTAFTTLDHARTKLTNTSGAQLFVVADETALDARSIASAGGRILSSPRIAVGERAQAQMAMCERVTIGSGTNVHPDWVGFWLDVWPRVNADSIDLTCFLTSSERSVVRTNDGGAMMTNGFFIRTNAAFGARVRVPRNGSVFLISGRTNQNGKVIGAVLSPKVMNTGGK